MRSIKSSIIILFVFHGLFNICYANEYAVFEKNERKGLRDQRGKELIPPEYDELGWSTGASEVIDGVIGYKKNGDWGIISINNNKVTDARYKDLIPCGKNCFIASIPDNYKLNRIYGVINPTGKIIIDFKYYALQPFGANFIVGKKVKSNYVFGLVSPKDEAIIPPVYTTISLVTDNILALSNAQQKIRLFDIHGKMLPFIPLDQIHFFEERFLMVYAEGRNGLIDLNGQKITPIEFQKFSINENDILSALPSKNWDILFPDGTFQRSLEYEELTPIDTGYYSASRLNYSFIVNEEGKEIFKIRNSGICFLNDSLASFQYRNKYGVIDYEGDTIISPHYDSIVVSGHRFFLYTRKSNKQGWLMADLYGIVLSDEEFESVYFLDDTHLAFQKNGFWGIMDKYGQEKIYPKYDSVYSKINDYYLVNFYGETGVVNESGEWKIYPQKGDLYFLDNGNYLISSYFQSRVIGRWGNELYRSENYLWPFRNGFIEEDFEENFGLLDQNFNHIIPIENAFISPIIKDSIFLFRNHHGWGIADISGKVLLKDDNRFEQIVGYNEEFLGVKIDGAYGFVDLKGNLRIANRYEGIDLFHEGLANIKILGKWGCVNKIETIVVQPYYDHIGQFRDGYAIAKKSGGYGILNDQGSQVVNFEYDSIYRMKNGNFICMMNRKYGLINKKAEIMFYPKYDSILDLDNGLVIAERKNKFGVFSSEGVFIIPVIYDHISYNPYEHVFMVSQDPDWKIVMNLNEAKLY